MFEELVGSWNRQCAPRMAGYDVISLLTPTPNRIVLPGYG